MSQFNRFLWTGLLVVGVAACGDDVTVTNPPEPPPPPVPGVTAVSVAPDGATINVGATLGMTAAATLEAGAAAPTWAWSSSATSIATVAGTTASATVTGVAVGSAGIRATATSGTSSASGVATVTVSAQTVTPATVSIGAINNAAGAPANINALAGQANIVINLERGGEQVTKLALLVDNTEVWAQNFASGSAEASSPELAIETITAPWNTAEFNPTTGETRWKNQAHTLSARVTTVQNQQGSGSPTINVITANPNTIVGDVTLTGTTATANGPGGVLYSRGGLAVSVFPVVYSGTLNVTSATAAFGSALCDANGSGARSITLTAPAAGSVAWTGAFAQTNPQGGNILTNVGSYEFSTAACAAGFPTGEFVRITAVGSDGNPLLTNVAVGNGLRLDNRAPTPVPLVNENPNGRQAGWLNDAVSFTAVASGANPDRIIGVGSADAGVGGVIYRARAGATLADAVAAEDISNATTLAPTATGTSLCLVLYAIDALGNRTANPAAPCDAGDADNNTLIGVDRAPPTIAYALASMADGDRQNGGNIGGNFVVTVTDTGAIGNSGVRQPIPVNSNVIRREADGTNFATAPTDCVQGTLNAAQTVCSQSTGGFTLLTYAAPNVFTNIAVLTVVGYYTHTATAFDGAGNSTALPGSSTIVYDNVPVQVQAPAVPAVITGPFSAAAFLNDNLSIRDYFWTVQYGTALVNPALIDLGAPTVVDAFNAATLSNINYGVNSTVSTFLALQATDGANTPLAFDPMNNLLSGLALSARDQAQAAYTESAFTPLAPSGLTAASGIAIASAGPPAWSFNTFVPTTSNATICAGTDPQNNPCLAVPTSTVLRAVANGTTGSFNNPFGRVDFYAVNDAGTRVVLIGSVPAAAAGLTDDGANRAWSYSLTMNAATLYNLLGGVSPAIVGPVNVYAFGVRSNGAVALVSQPVAQTINP